MKAVAVSPGKPDSAHLRDLPMPSLDEIPDGRGVLVKVLRVGLDGTDKEINAAEYGSPPPGEDFLIIGHESFGIVEETGPAVTGLVRGDYAVATVRRPGGSLYDRIGMQDMTTDDVCLERGINLRHGFLAEYFVEAEEYIVKIPPGLRHVGVLLEPASVIEKGIAQAYEIQRRMRIWRPRRAAVLGAGPVGLLAAMALRLRGLDVCAFGLRKPPYLNADLLREIGACYHSTRDTSLTDATGDHGPFDIIFEATGYSPIVFEAMNVLGKNGVLVLSMPDKWEYPWFAAWDLAFHMIPFAEIDPEFAKAQILLFLREWYMHPSGQIPAYEFAFSDVNPPVHAWAAWQVYKRTGPPGKRDRVFLARAFQKLMLNFTTWPPNSSSTSSPSPTP